MFFYAMYREGGELRYAQDATVYERVSPSRLSAKWIVIRKYRAGQVRGFVYHKLDRAYYRRLALAAPIKVATCLLMAMIAAPMPSRSLWWLMRGVFHFGLVSFSLGSGIHMEYGPKRGMA
jgi:succinoglycan biosynthesis protein ExoM